VFVLDFLEIIISEFDDFVIDFANFFELFHPIQEFLFLRLQLMVFQFKSDLFLSFTQSNV
jgi:hypothetical protein